MAREVDIDFIANHAHMFDRVQLPGRIWVPADVIYRNGELFYQQLSETGERHLPVGSFLQAAGMGIVKYVKRPT